MTECACFKEEQNKEQMVLVGYALGLADLLQRGGVSRSTSRRRI